nr:MAG TPA: hypothetical protein [Caudoviricetes sp.]
MKACIEPPPEIFTKNKRAENALLLSRLFVAKVLKSILFLKVFLLHKNT